MMQVDALSKDFGRRPAIRDISFEVAPGEIFGLLGHNGAGKSTTFGICLGQIHADRGRVVIDGFDVANDRARALDGVGAIYEAPAFYDYLSGWRNLEFFVSLSAVPDRKRLEEVVDLVGLAGRIQDPVRTYSHGMRQRLALAQALLPSPRLILLDEPTEGLDPEGIHEIRETIRRLRDERGLSIVLSSHLLHEVEQLCDRVAILQAGQLVFSGRWQDARKNQNVFRIVGDAGLSDALLELGAASAGPNRWHLPHDAEPAHVLRKLIESGSSVGEFAREIETLEDFYLGLLTKP
ncbi:MAG: ABC transporter ATP-binding protein [Terrimicrobiaceae bacterium]|nr:ABC transporter ATP-binding protein [Terrimicrobiaceae bacterium]